uniref:Uncharacterized protein n=1 Tax=Micrurus lemniscatus lemniscatus TaxID=129467 RepID=A0A2D4IWA8_MICLE
MHLLITSDFTAVNFYPTKMLFPFDLLNSLLIQRFTKIEMLKSCEASTTSLPSRLSTTNLMSNSGRVIWTKLLLANSKKVFVVQQLQVFSFSEVLKEEVSLWVRKCKLG